MPLSPIRNGRSYCVFFISAFFHANRGSSAGSRALPQPERVMKLQGPEPKPCISTDVAGLRKTPRLCAHRAHLQSDRLPQNSASSCRCALCAHKITSRQGKPSEIGDFQYRLLSSNNLIASVNHVARRIPRVHHQWRLRHDPRIVDRCVVGCDHHGVLLSEEIVC